MNQWHTAWVIHIERCLLDSVGCCGGGTSQLVKSGEFQLAYHDLIWLRMDREASDFHNKSIETSMFCGSLVCACERYQTSLQVLALSKLFFTLHIYSYTSIFYTYIDGIQSHQNFQLHPVFFGLWQALVAAKTKQAMFPMYLF